MSKPFNRIEWQRLFGLACILLVYIAKGQGTEHSYSISKLSVSSSFSDISPVILPGGLAFVSNREDEMGVNRFSETQEEPLYKIYYSSKSANGYGKPTKVTGEINHHYSEGPISFTSDGKTLFFSRSLPLLEDNRSGKKARMGIFMASYENGHCQNIQPFPYNKPEYSLAHPSLASNGNYIIFASNMPGGFGGSDLYVSYLKEGSWSKPINLGKDVNTKENEVFPFVNKDGRLFFSSDGRTGSGGLDIFSASYKNFEWGEVKNLGTPFNSHSDDFGYVESADRTTGFFCSNRDANTKDDIYQFQMSQFVFSECDTLKEQNYCRTFYEERTPSEDSLPLMYEWDFGNNVKKRGLEVNHCFEKPGKYIVQLNTIDLITNQLYMNEASYELEIAPIRGPYFTVSDTIELESVFSLDASNTKVEHAQINQYYWDFSDGTLLEGKYVNHSYKMPGTYALRLGINCSDSSNPAIFSKCVVKNVEVMPHSFFKSRKRYAYKPFYRIKDRNGNVYRIQIATSKEKLNTESGFFKEIGDVKEYYDRGIFGYTVGDFSKPALCYPELKKVREKGFKEAVVIAMKENKVVSGTDSSFYVKLPADFHFVRVVSIHGKVLDQDGKPIKTSILLEDLETGIRFDEFKTDSVSGKYEMELPIGKAYAYYIYKDGYFPFGNYLDLTKNNDLAEIRSDLFLMSLDRMNRDSIPVRVNNIFFSSVDSVLKDVSKIELKRMAEFIKKYPAYTLVVASHTDNIGDKKAKLVVSERRAEAIKSYLMAEGVDEERIVTRAYGVSKPLTLSPKMQKINDRIEMMLLKDPN